MFFYLFPCLFGHSNRFKAAVSVAGVANTVSMYAQSDINHGEIARWEFMGVPVLNMENFQRSSPLHYLKNCTTPTLLIHGEADDRVPVMQSWEIYRALEDGGGFLLCFVTNCPIKHRTLIIRKNS